MKSKRLFTYLLLIVYLTACAPGDIPVMPSQSASTATSEPQGEKGPVYISSAELLIMESFPVQVRLQISGDLPTPCHSFQAEVSEPDAQNRIDVTAYSLYNPNLMCAQVLQPFDESVSTPISGQADGTYSVYLNGEFVGEFSYPG